MIKVNLIGTGRKKQVHARKVTLPRNFTPVLLILIVLGAAYTGYSWYSKLTAQSTDLDQQIRTLDSRKTALEAVIKADQIFEARKKILESRVKIIEGLQKNQVSPVLALD